jgi:hypothetical protein
MGKNSKMRKSRTLKGEWEDDVDPRIVVMEK